MEADALYREALAHGPPSVSLLNNLGNHSLTCGSPKEAQRYFEKVIRSDSTHFNANLQLARLATAEKNGTLALQYLNRIKDTSTPILLLKAEANYYAGRPAESLQILDGLRANGQPDLRVTFTVGLTCARLGLYDRAENAFSEVLATRPNDFDVLVNLGRAAARAKHFDRALRALEVAARLQPTNVECLAELAAVYAAIEDYDRAVFTLAQARRVDPKRPDVLLALAHAAEQAGYFGDAVLAYDEYLQLRSGDDIARRDRARVCGQIPERAGEGRAQLLEYLKRHPQDAIGHFDLAQLLWRTQPDEALVHLGAAVQIDPKLTAAYYARAWLFRRLGRIEESLADLKQCVAQQPTNVRALDQMALAYLSLDQPSEAERALQQAAILAPQDTQVLLHRSRALIALNRPAEAEECLTALQRLPGRRERNPKFEAGMIDLATMSQSDRIQREVARLRTDARTHPGDADLQYHLARLLLMAGEEGAALEAYKELLKINADSRTIWQAGVDLSHAGKWALAVDFLERASETLSSARLDLAMALVKTNRASDALLALEQVPKIERGGDYFLIRAQVLHAAGKAEEAEDALQSGLRLAVSRPTVARQSAVLLVRLNRQDDAADVLARAVSASPDDPDLLLDRAAVLAVSGSFESSEGEIKRIEARWPEWSRAYVLHGLLLRQMNRIPEGLLRFQMAATLDSDAGLVACLRDQPESPRAENGKCPCATTIRDFLLFSCATP